MMKKILIISGILLTGTYGLLSWSIVAHSEPPNPDDSIYAETCKTQGTPSQGVEGPSYDMCCIDYNEAMDAVERDWNSSLQALIDQEIPASEMVEDGYASLRTYNCWLEYICRTVEFSGRAPVESGIGTGLTNVHLGQVPGCQKPEDMGMGPEWGSFVSQMEEVPLVGPAFGQIDDLYMPSKINILPRCMTDPNNNQSPRLPKVNQNYQTCKESLELRFGCKPGVPDFLCLDQSNAFVKLETVLKKTSADQKSTALETKLGSILNQMQGMEAHVGYFSNFLEQLNNRFACFAAKCT